jgi:hypothetical protein
LIFAMKPMSLIWQMATSILKLLYYESRHVLDMLALQNLEQSGAIGMKTARA